MTNWISWLIYSWLIWKIDTTLPEQTKIANNFHNGNQVPQFLMVRSEVNKCKLLEKLQQKSAAAH